MVERQVQGFGCRLSVLRPLIPEVTICRRGITTDHDIRMTCRDRPFEFSIDSDICIMASWITSPMADRNYSRYQQKVIKRFYDNREQIDEQQLSELVTSLFLANDKQKPKLWQRAKNILDRMKLPQSRVDHVMGSEDPVVLAKIVEELQNGKLKRGSGKKLP